ncbi:MAG: bifunctional helix-turn-helix domain-containing protein/methylated-DNA--[protein]-cysteine S-methyltransferase [Gammaproteobacteria bacterium]|nr:bifunctional helix-turn-helix domain-containing protein/methylated-DNA--[protein]-cysteine S-methyltransferase [Gammaproteobacteria bacterium]
MASRNDSAPLGGDDYTRIAQAIGFLRDRQAQQPSLGDLARHLGLSEAYTQRLFSRWAGISPKRFLQFLSVESAKRRMRETGDLLGVALGAGLSGPGRLHDLFVNMEAMTPGEFRRAAAGVKLYHGCAETPFGAAQVVYSGRGICRLAFVGESAAAASSAELAESWPGARLQHDAAGSAALLARVFTHPPTAADRGLSLWVGGSNFQIQVWRALLRVPFGGLLSYRQLAHLVGRPAAARAVGSAVARNPIAYLIPCHRVLRETGDFGSYHWGEDRKRAICVWEAAGGIAAAGDRAGR